MNHLGMYTQVKIDYVVKCCFMPIGKGSPFTLKMPAYTLVSIMMRGSRIKHGAEPCTCPTKRILHYLSMKFRVAALSKISNPSHFLSDPDNNEGPLLNGLDTAV